MTQIEYARHAGLSRARVSQLVKLGLPLDSPDGADAWRKLGPRLRPPPSRVPAPSVSIPDSPPPSPDRSAPPPSIEATADLGEDSILGAFERQRQIERATYSLAVAAVRDRRPEAGRLVSVHGASVTGLAKAKSEILALEQREGRLVHADWVRKIMTDHDGAVVSLIRAMPKTLAGRIAPHDPVHAEAELARWVDDTFLATLNATSPWKQKDAQ